MGLIKSRSLVIWIAGVLAAAASMGISGCGSPGEGTIKLSPNARSTMETPGSDAKKVSGKAAKAKALEEEAKQKDPKRF
jgi:hypothetical protein